MNTMVTPHEWRQITEARTRAAAVLLEMRPAIQRCRAALAEAEAHRARMARLLTLTDSRPEGITTDG